MSEERRQPTKQHKGSA